MTQDINLNKTVKIFNRRYLGSKTKLIPFISDIVASECKNTKSFADIFGGTGVVASFFSNSHKIIINDLLSSNFHAYQTWFGKEFVDSSKIKNIIDEANLNICKVDNYFSKNFSNKYFSKENAKKIGSFRENIEKLFSENLITSREKSILLTSLIYAADKVANTCGHYDAYRKKMEMNNDIIFQIPDYNEYKVKHAKIYNEDANSLVKRIKSDIVYIDPPYNSRQYSDTYHLLENISEWNKPKLFGVAKKMKDRKHLKSMYCYKSAPLIFDELIQNIKSKFIIVSYNNMETRGNARSQSKISKQEIMQILSKRGSVKVFEKDFKQFTTGKTKKGVHKELLYVCKI